MLSEKGATIVALRFLSAEAEDDGIERVLLGRPVQARAQWVFFFQGRGYVERDDLDEMLGGNMPIVVPGDGEPSYALSPPRRSRRPDRAPRSQGSRRPSPPMNR